MEHFDIVKRFIGWTARDIKMALADPKGYEEKVLARQVTGMCEYSGWRDQSEHILNGGNLTGEENGYLSFFDGKETYTITA